MSFICPICGAQLQATISTYCNVDSDTGRLLIVDFNIDNIKLYCENDCKNDYEYEHEDLLGKIIEINKHMDSLGRELDDNELDITI